MNAAVVDDHGVRRTLGVLGSQLVDGNPVRVTRIAHHCHGLFGMNAQPAVVATAFGGCGHGHGASRNDQSSHGQRRSGLAIPAAASEVTDVAETPESARARASAR